MKSTVPCQPTPALFRQGAAAYPLTTVWSLAYILLGKEISENPLSIGRAQTFGQYISCNARN